MLELTKRGNAFGKIGTRDFEHCIGVNIVSRVRCNKVSLDHKGNNI